MTLPKIKHGYIKYITRDYTLLEHSLIEESIVEGSKHLPKVFYQEPFIDVYNGRSVDIYVHKEDFEKSKNRVMRFVKKDPRYISRCLAYGRKALNTLNKFAKFSPLNQKLLSTKYLISKLEEFRKALIDFGGFFDFTHFLGHLPIQLSKFEMKELAYFHDHRKIIYMNYFKSLKNFTRVIAKEHSLASDDLSFLLFHEILKFLNGHLSKSEVDAMQVSRRKHCLLYCGRDKELVFSGRDFAPALKKFNKHIISETTDKKILSGKGVWPGVVRGEVQNIVQSTPISLIKRDKIIVAPMTTPILTTVLKKSRAIVTDEGGLLCHAANIAREFKIPCVVGTKTATQVLKDGDKVEVDANKGIVRKII